MFSRATLACLALAAACSSSVRGAGTRGDGGTTCAPGSTQACLGSGQCAGVQRCEPDGLSYAACECAGSGGASGDAAGGSSGAPVGGAAGSGGGSAGEDAGTPDGAAGRGGSAAGGPTDASAGAAGLDGAAGSDGAACPAPGPGVSRWPDSSPSCLGDTAPPCANAGEDGNLEDSAVMVQVGGGLATDGVTGLVWETGVSTFNRRWDEAASYCAGLGVGGHLDWRLPSLVELSSIVDYGRENPASVNLGGTPGAFYWSGDAHDGASSWGINFNTGLATWFSNSVPGLTRVRCVRGSSTVGSTAVRTTCSPPTVYDATTNLEWELQAPAGAVTWTTAMDRCATLGSTWRLPTLKELVTIVDVTRNPVYVAAFAGEPGSRFWSSTPVRGTGASAWVLDFGVGLITNGITPQQVVGSTQRHRCVRAR